MFNVYRKDVSVICWSFRGERSEEPFVVHKNTHASSLFVSHSYNHLIDGDLNILLVVFQAVIAVLAVSFSKIVGWVEYPAFNIATAKQWAPVNITFCAMLFTGMASLPRH